MMCGEPMNCNQHPFESPNITHRFCAVISTERVICASPIHTFSVVGSTREPKPLLMVDVVQVVAVAMLGGAVLQAVGVSAGNGTVIDWREVKSGWTMLDNADAYDTAQLFVDLVGVDGALEALAKHGMMLQEATGHDAPAKREVPKVSTYMEMPNGGRQRSFDVGEFSVMVRNHKDDAAQASFTQWLAEQVANYHKTTTS